MAKVKVNLSTQADEVNVKPQGEVTRTLPKDVDLDRVEMVPRLFSESVDAPVEAGQVLGTMGSAMRGRSTELWTWWRIPRWSGPSCCTISLRWSTFSRTPGSSSSWQWR